MRLVVNGADMVIQAATLAEVIEHFGLRQKPVIAELDGTIVDRGAWESTALRDGMKLELVHFVGGG